MNLLGHFNGQKNLFVFASIIFAQELLDPLLLGKFMAEFAFYVFFQDPSIFSMALEITTQIDITSRNQTGLSLLIHYRGTMELMIKEHKNHLLSERTSFPSFSANQFRLFLHSAAYLLLHTFRALDLKGTEWASAQFDILCLKTIKIGARIRQLSRKIRIHLLNSSPWSGELQKIWLSFAGAGHT